MTLIEILTAAALIGAAGALGLLLAIIQDRYLEEERDPEEWRDDP